MSLRALTRVWEHSRCKGSELLTLLAIADYARDDGSHAFPSIQKLAQKTRMSERNVQLVLHKLEGSGELCIDRNAGPYGCHFFHVIFQHPEGGEKITPPPPAEVPPRPADPPEGCKTPTPEGVKITPNPSLDPTKDPSDFSSSFSTKEKKGAVVDVTSPRGKAPVPWPTAVPHGMLPATTLTPDAYAALYRDAEAVLRTEGVKALCLVRPVIEARMSVLLEAHGGAQAVLEGCLHEHVDEETEVCKDCGEVLASAA